MLKQSSMMLNTHSNTTSAIVSQVGRWVTVCNTTQLHCLDGKLMQLIGTAGSS